jgi:CHAD domain-containing protein/CYTH domain-containing protein
VGARAGSAQTVEEIVVAKGIDGLMEMTALGGVSRIGLEYLDRASEAANRLEDSSDEQALHDFRVSLRRLRTLLQAYDPYLEGRVGRKLRRRIRGLAAMTGQGRDSEVLLALLKTQRPDLKSKHKPGYRAVAALLERDVTRGYGAVLDDVRKEYAGLRKKLVRRLTRPEDKGGPADLVRLAVAAQRLIPVYAGELEYRLSSVHALGDAPQAHRARIRAKRLRYLLEPLSSDVPAALPLIESLKGLQDLFGDLRDAHLLEETIESFRQSDDPGIIVGVDRLSRAMRDRQVALFDQIRAEWLGDRSGEFFNGVRELTDGLGSLPAPDVEIERKYLLRGFPEAVRGTEYQEIEQGYLPGERLQERVRRVRSGNGGVSFIRTVKIGSGIQRVQLEEETDQRIFDALWPLTEGKRVVKRRYRVRSGRFIWEVDRFRDRDLVLAEVELPTVDTKVDIPDWLEDYVVREVTDEFEYVNINLAC